MSSPKLERALEMCYQKYRLTLNSDKICPEIPKSLKMVINPNVERQDSDSSQSNQIESEKSVVRLSINLDIDRLKHLTHSLDSGEYSLLSEEGLAPLAYAIQDDDPVII